MKRHQNDGQQSLREFYQRSADRALIWIDDGSGRIVDELGVETRIRPGEGGCQLCHEELDGSEAHGEIDFDERGLPRLLFGPGGPICAECVEWVRWLRHYASIGPISGARFEPRALVLRVGTDELYQVHDWYLTGVPAAGVWVPVYICHRIEVRESGGQAAPACLGLEFELADVELQPVPQRHGIGGHWKVGTDHRTAALDLVGPKPSRLVTERHNDARHNLELQATARLLLPDKGGGS